MDNLTTEERVVVEAYKKQLEMFLAPMGIEKGDKFIKDNESINDGNKNFLREKMLRMNSGNVEGRLLDIAIDELLPYLRNKR